MTRLAEAVGDGRLAIKGDKKRQTHLEASVASQVKPLEFHASSRPPTNKGAGTETSILSIREFTQRIPTMKADKTSPRLPLVRVATDDTAMRATVSGRQGQKIELEGWRPARTNLSGSPSSLVVALAPLQGQDSGRVIGVPVEQSEFMQAEAIVYALRQDGYSAQYQTDKDREGHWSVVVTNWSPVVGAPPEITADTPVDCMPNREEDAARKKKAEEEFRSGPSTLGEIPRRDAFPLRFPNCF
jgi:hypothetical protein